MRLLLCFTLFTIICSIHFTQAGIYRRYVRRNRPRPRLPMPTMMPQDNHFAKREFQLYVPTPWPALSLFRRTRSHGPWSYPSYPGVPEYHQYQSSRMARRFRHPNERADTVPHFHHQPSSHHPYSMAPTMTPRYPMSSTPFSAWRPLDYGNPIDRDPTYDYAPPSIERVRFHTQQNRRTTARSHVAPTHPSYTNRQPPPPPPAYNKRPSLWKMLAHKQRPNRPFPQHQRHHAQSHPTQGPNRPPFRNQLYPEEAEIYPHIPNMVYFRPNDVMPSSRRPGGPPPMGYHPRRPQGRPTTEAARVSDPSPFSGEATSNSDLNVVTVDRPAMPGNKEYLFTVVGYKGQPPNFPPTRPPPVVVTTKKPPTVLHAVKTTPITITTTHNSAVKPFEPTESLEHHRNHNNHPEEDSDESPEESENIEKEVKANNKKKQNIPPVSVTSGKQKDDVETPKREMLPPAPIFPNSFNILESVKDGENDEDSDMEIEPENEIPGTVIEIPSAVKPRPVFNNAVKNSAAPESYKTSTSVSISMSKTDDIPIPTKAPKITTTKKPTTTTTQKPSSSSTTTTSTTTFSPTTEATTPKSTKFPRLPTMPTYKKKPTPVYARKNKNGSNSPLSKYSSSSSSSSLAKEMNGSGEIVVITAGRSKVKEYKPQFIGDSSQLLTFDKVAESSSKSSSAEVSSTPSPSTSTTKSPLQEFDPMQLLHSWFTKSSD